MHYQIKAPVLFLAVLLFLPFSAHGIEPPAPEIPDCGVLYSDQMPYLGVTSSFGRWENGVVPIAYSHANVPNGLGAAEVETWIKSALAIIEGVADVRFDYRGLTQTPYWTQWDSLAVIAWAHLHPTILGQAEITQSLGNKQIFERNGYWAYTDGAVLLNLARLETLDSSVLIHELLHLLGLHHSENPVSIMNRQYGRYRYPQPDDIAALQALYGPPDVFIQPTFDPGLRPEPLQSGMTIEEIRIRMNNGRPTSPDRFSPYPGFPQKLDENFVIDGFYHELDYIVFEMDYANADPRTDVTLWWTDPIGNTEVSTTVGTGFTERGRITFSYGSVRSLRLVPGLWTFSFAVGQALLAEVQFEVSDAPVIFNQTPSARLNVQADGRGGFAMDLQASDPESDSLSTGWHIPGRDQTRGMMQLDHKVTDGNHDPVQIFVDVKDNFRRASYHGNGFGTVDSAYLVTPAEANVPTYFVSDRLLHVPVAEGSGGGYSLDFKLTALPGITFKFLDINTMAPVSGGGASFEPTDHSIYMPKMIVVDGDTQTAYFDLRFEVDFDAQPIRMTLR